MLSKRQSKINHVLPCNLNVREFRPEDTEAVKKIYRTHFRSLSLPAVKYYLLEHFRDLVALLVISLIFQSFVRIVMSVVLFLLYLLIRARIELELYISRDCPDLDDVVNYYAVNDPNARSNFWVAEGAAGSPLLQKDGQKSRNGNNQSPATNTEMSDARLQSVLGCVGCMPTRDDPNTAQLVRLVVAEDARRRRIGSRLLAQFENFAIEKGYREVRLYTNNLNTSHMKFILQHGYEIIQCVSRTLMRGSLIQWKKRLRTLSEDSDILMAPLLVPSSLPTQQQQQLPVIPTTSIATTTTRPVPQPSNESSSSSSEQQQQQPPPPSLVTGQQDVSKRLTPKVVVMD